MQPYTETVLERVVVAVGSRKAIAREIKVSYQAVCKWRRVPERHCKKLERLTGISKHEMRPDIWGPEESGH